MWTHQGKEHEGGQTYDGKMSLGEIWHSQGWKRTTQQTGRKLFSYTGDPRWRDKPGMKKLISYTGDRGWRHKLGMKKKSSLNLTRKLFNRVQLFEMTILCLKQGFSLLLVYSCRISGYFWIIQEGLWRTAVVHDPVTMFQDIIGDGTTKPFFTFIQGPHVREVHVHDASRISPNVGPVCAVISFYNCLESSRSLSP